MRKSSHLKPLPGKQLKPRPRLPLPLQQEYKFEPSEIEKKPYHLGGYFEFRPILYGLDKEGALYKLNFLNKKEGGTIQDYDGRLWLEGSYEKGIVGFFLKENLEPRLTPTKDGTTRQESTKVTVP